jgi:hypothetical protein
LRVNQSQDIYEPVITTINYKHGDAPEGKKTQLYRIWSHIKNQCYNKAGFEYSLYGGRGLTVHRPWLEYIAFKEWALETGYKKGLALHRRDKSRGYMPSNLEWLTRSENIGKNNNSKRLFKWTVIQSIRDSNASVASLARVYGVATYTIWKIVNRVTYKNDVPGANRKDKYIEQVRTKDKRGK